MKIVFKHFFAALGGAIIAPTSYFFVTAVHAQFITPNVPPPSTDIVVQEIPTAATIIQTPTSSQTPTPTPQANQTPTPILTKPAPTKTPTSTPTSTPAPTLPLVTSTQLDAWFTTYSNQYGIDRQKLWRVAVCESGLNIHAKNGDYGGLY